MPARRSSGRSVDSPSQEDPFTGESAQTELYPGTPSQSSQRATRSTRPDPFSYTDSPEEPQMVIRRRGVQKKAGTAVAGGSASKPSPASRSNKSSVQASPAIAPRSIKSSMQASPAIPATPATPSEGGGTPLRTPNRKKEVARIKKANDQKNLFAVPQGRETRESAKRKQPEEGRGSGPAPKKTRPVQTPERQRTPVNKRAQGGAAPSAVRALSWKQIKPLKTVSAVNFYGAKDEEELDRKSFLVEDNGVLVRTEYKQELAELTEVVEDFKQRLATSADKAEKAQKKIDQLMEQEDPEDEEALKAKQARLQRLEKTVERFKAAHEKQRQICEEKEEELAGLKEGQGSIYVSPGSMPVQVKQSGAIFGLGDETRRVDTKCLVPRIFVERAHKGDRQKAQNKATRITMKDYAGANWSVDEVDIELVKELGRK